MAKQSSKTSQAYASTLESGRKAQQIASESAQEIARINQEAAMQLGQILQQKIAELMKMQSPQAAFEMVQSDILKDAAIQVLDYQKKVKRAIKAGNFELQEIANEMIDQSKADLIHFVNEATHNAPAGSQAYVSVFQNAFNSALQNFELIRASTAESFAKFEQSVEKLDELSRQNLDQAFQNNKHHSRR